MREEAEEERRNKEAQEAVNIWKKGNTTVTEEDWTKDEKQSKEAQQKEEPRVPPLPKVDNKEEEEEKRREREDRRIIDLMTTVCSGTIKAHIDQTEIIRQKEKTTERLRYEEIMQ